ncbi:MAG: hypothetical protein GF398_00280 [Chitinivibrionales bacterium]|nr:hypothetical protein [Chitinivibrionales bacterium]
MKILSAFMLFSPLLFHAYCRAGTTTISIYGFKSINIPDDIAASLQEHIESNLLGYPHYSVLSRNDIDKILEENWISGSGLCNENSCLIETGNILGVQKLITGTIGKVGRTHNIVLKLIDIEEGRLEASSSRRYAGTIDSLFSVATLCVGDLLKSGSGTSVAYSAHSLPKNIDTVIVIDTVTIETARMKGNSQKEIKLNAHAPGSSITAGKEDNLISQKHLTHHRNQNPEKTKQLARQIGRGAIAIFASLAAIIIINLSL